MSILKGRMRRPRVKRRRPKRRRSRRTARRQWRAKAPRMFGLGVNSPSRLVQCLFILLIRYLLFNNLVCAVNYVGLI
jgi:hypothetical protein